MKDGPFRERPLHIPWFITLDKASRKTIDEAARDNLDPSTMNRIGIVCATRWRKTAQIAFNFLMDRTFAIVIEAIVAHAQITKTRSSVNYLGLSRVWQALGIDWSQSSSNSFLRWAD
jgi:hypothetical protein